MRINKFVAQASGLSRRAADAAIAEGRVLIDGKLAQLGDTVASDSSVTLDDQPISAAIKTTTIMLNKPVGYVCSRNGQGSQTIYELLPKELHHLKPVGRLDKDSSGLLLLTDDGELANQLTHPRYAKTKIYEITLDKSLEPLHQQLINDTGIQLDDGRSQLQLHKLDEAGKQWQVTMQEGRNRQIRRTFAALGYTVTSLHRTNFGNYVLQNLPSGQIKEIN
jgi:23S rRNA pseudouridine2605 synthase